MSSWPTTTETRESASGCRLRAAADANVLHAGADILLSCSGFKFETNFTAEVVQATRDQRTDTVGLWNETR